VRSLGDADQALATAMRTIAADYHVPRLTHSSIEPPVAVARVDERGCEIWAATQNPQAAQTEVAKALGLDSAQVTVHVTFLGGGFGRKSKPDYVVEAALLARHAKAPVRVQWTRADEIRNSYYHSCSTQRLEAGLDAAGKVVAWRDRVASPSIGSTFDQTVTSLSPDELGQGILDLPLAVPAVCVESCEARAHVRIGWLRSVHNINSAFAVQSFIAEIAAMTYRDPREVLLEVIGPTRILSPAAAGVKNLPNYGEKIEEYPVDVGRLRHVIERATERAGWTTARRAGRALGLAAHHSFLTAVAAVAAVSRDALGLVQVDEVWITADAGRVVNPDRVRAQLEGAVAFGISLALHGAITMRRGAVEQTNFRDYRVARIAEVPRAIHVELIEREARPGGVGEPGVPPIAPAIANAVFELTGKRVRELPLRRAGV
jgi:isoquinoline 1-oxidoreductase beta subunit